MEAHYRGKLFSDLEVTFYQCIRDVPILASDINAFEIIIVDHQSLVFLQISWNVIQRQMVPFLVRFAGRGADRLLLTYCAFRYGLNLSQAKELVEK